MSSFCVVPDASQEEGCTLYIVYTMLAICLSAICISLIRAESVEVTEDISDAVKIVEQYVLDANFDNAPVAQVPNSGGALQLSELEKNTSVPEASPNDVASRIVTDYNKFPTRMDPLVTSFQGQPSDEAWSIYPPAPSTMPYDSALKQSNLAPLVVSQRSVLAVGFITFLILLQSLQNSLMNMVLMKTASARPSTSLLGGVTQALGRRRRR